MIKLSSRHYTLNILGRLAIAKHQFVLLTVYMKKTKRKPENLMKKEYRESYDELKKSVMEQQERNLKNKPISKK